MVTKVETKPIDIPRKRGNVVNDDTREIWKTLCSTHHPYAIEMLEQNITKIDWDILSTNPYALPLLKRYRHRVNWFYLLFNPNKNVIHLVDSFVL